MSRSPRIFTSSPQPSIISVISDFGISLNTEDSEFGRVFLL